MKYSFILYLSKTLILIAFYFIVYNTHITKITQHISLVWIIVMFISQILSFIYAVINDLIWDKLMSSIFIIGLSYIIYIKSKYEIQPDVELNLKLKNILT